MEAPSIDIKDMLVAESALNLVYPTNIFTAKAPTDPKDCVIIYDTPGFSPDLTMDVVLLENPSINIRVRNTDYATGWALATLIKNALHGRANETWNTSYYMVIVCTNGPFFLNWDENRLANFSINFNVKRR